MAANNTISKLFVVGGSGFVGRAICERAVKMPKEIIGTVQSFSRRGVPESATMENSNNIWNLHIRNGTSNEVLEQFIAKYNQRNVPAELGEPTLLAG